jgi:hypothetical protein
MLLEVGPWDAGVELVMRLGVAVIDSRRITGIVERSRVNDAHVQMPLPVVFDYADVRQLSLLVGAHGRVSRQLTYRAVKLIELCHAPLVMRKIRRTDQGLAGIHCRKLEENRDSI